jgi:hypothetical protein
VSDHLSQYVALTSDSFWVVRHGKLVTTRLDPIINPEAVSSHGE